MVAIKGVAWGNGGSVKMTSRGMTRGRGARGSVFLKLRAITAGSMPSG